MRKPVIVIFILLLLEAVSGCTSPVRRQLDRAEAVMESAPDSALAILDSIDTASLTRASDRALYALLLTQGRIKTYEVLTDDSLVSTAVRYYEDHGPDSNLMKSLFYQGEILTNNREFSKAIIPSMRAREMAISADNPYWHAKASELIGNIHNSTYLYEESLKFILEGAEKYKEAGKIVNHLFSISDLANGYYNLNEAEKSLSLADSVYKVAVTHKYDSFLISYTHIIKFNNYYKRKKFDKADSIASILEDFRNFIDNSKKLSFRGAITKMELGDFEEIDKLVHLCKVDSLGLNDLYRLQILSLYNKKIGNYAEAYEFLDSAMVLQDKDIIKQLKQSVISRQRDYLLSERETERDHITKIKISAIVTCVLIFIILLFLIYHHRQRLRIKNLLLRQRMDDIFHLTSQVENFYQRNHELEIELNKRQQDIQALQKTIDSKDGHINELNLSVERQNIGMKDQLKTVHKEKWELLNELCGKYLDEESSFSRQALVKKIELQILHARRKESIDDIRNCIDRFNNNIIGDMIKSLPYLKEEDIDMITLIFAGFSSKSICFFLDMKLKTFYTRKTRLIEKIQNSDSCGKDRFIQKLIRKN